MCIHPSVVNRRYAGKTKVDIVPCGKCYECIRKKQNEFAALACLEAKRSSSMWFFTLTYDNSSCPIAVSPVDDSNGMFFKFADKEQRLNYVSRSGFTMDGSRKLEPMDIDGMRYVPSLRREDFRLFLKHCRLKYNYRFSESLIFRYACFGEYGDHTNRPHLHALFFNLSEKSARFLQECWKDEFGFCDCRPIPLLNPDGSPARVKVAKYVAKYLAKPKKDFPPLLEGRVEAPRRISSLRFGVGVCEDSLRDFIYAKI